MKAIQIQPGAIQPGIVRAAGSPRLQRGDDAGVRGGHERDGTDDPIWKLRPQQPLAGAPISLPVITKSTIPAFSRALAIECAADGIRANTVSPGVCSAMTWTSAASSSVLRLPSGAGSDRPTSPRLPRVMNNTALTGTTYDIGGGQQLAPGV
jgi:hypothetical protein